MPLSTIRGTGINLQPGYPISLGAGSTYLVPPGVWNVAAGQYTFIEAYNPTVGAWLPYIGTRFAGGNVQVEADGVNYRLANRTGCAVGATVTTAGSSYTTAPTVTASAGGSTWRALVGGLVNTTVTVTAGGSGYLYPPIIIPFGMSGNSISGGFFVAPSFTCTLSGGAVNAVTVVNQGAGLATAPGLLVLNDPRDTAGSGCVLTATLTGSGTISGVICTDMGTAQTSVPTLTFSSGSGAATVLGAWVAKTISAATGLGIIGQSALPTATNTNPIIENSIYIPRLGFTQYNSAAVILDGGIQLTQPQGWAVLASPAALTISAWGGVSDTSYILPV